MDPPISIVGLSNWVLDPAKMNRAVLVQRPEPSHSDISKTGDFIIFYISVFCFFIFCSIILIFPFPKLKIK